MNTMRIWSICLVVLVSSMSTFPSVSLGWGGDSGEPIDGYWPTWRQTDSGIEPIAFCEAGETCVLVAFRMEAGYLPRPGESESARTTLLSVEPFTVIDGDRAINAQVGSTPQGQMYYFIRDEGQDGIFLITPSVPGQVFKYADTPDELIRRDWLQDEAACSASP